jgi:MFS family permease
MAKLTAQLRPEWFPHFGRFWRLIAIRWMGQGTDGLYQSALAAFLLFSPERAASAQSAALAFAVVLLPYSLVGPIVGTLLDKYSRRQILLTANSLRAFTLVFVALVLVFGNTGSLLTLTVLVSFGINRLILAGLSAATPRLVSEENLIGANALSVTGGTIAIVLGGGLGVGLRKVFNTIANPDQADALLVVVAALAAALLALRMGKSELGPEPHQIAPAWFEGFNEMRAGFLYLWARQTSFVAIVVVAIQRGGLTALTLMALILERNTFNDAQDPDAGLGGFALALVLSGLGITLGAVITPPITRIVDRFLWSRWAMAAAAVMPIVFAFAQNETTLIAMGFFTGMAGQAVKVTNDAIVQQRTNDIFRGRVFAVYDVVVNGAIVSGALLCAFFLPPSGLTPVVPMAIALVYLCASLLLMNKRVFR